MSVFFLRPAARLLTVLLFALAFQLPDGARADREPMILPVDSTPLVIETDGGERSFSIEIADDNGERQRGLMYRRAMEDDRGMLFVFPESRRRGFWMKNTPMALDLLFVGEDGRVRAIAPGVPFSTATISPDVPARFVLELRAGTAQKAGIDIGDRLVHPEIAEAAGTE